MKQIHRACLETFTDIKSLFSKTVFLCGLGRRRDSFSIRILFSFSGFKSYNTVTYEENLVAQETEDISGGKHGGRNYFTSYFSS